ncbi:MAG: hypothetical protein K0S09_980 [Sphingobacteriaceae bacterium]|nr:hypothetical protein [Sphingobacteriaceae bacterium]
MKIVFLSLGLLWSSGLFAQELFVATEPASNMARHSVGIRLANEGMLRRDVQTRTNLEVMVGASKSLMLHANAYASDFYQKQQRLEGYGFYGKYRFLSVDSVQKHFRGAVFGRYASSSNPLLNDEISLEGDNTGWQAGVVFTQLLHRLALSATASYTKAYKNNGYSFLPGQDDQTLGYSLSSGYLISPKIYTDYKQTNMNIYLELLGKYNPQSGKNLMDAAPAIQFIFNSKFRVDVSQRFQLWGDMSRTTKNMYLVRLEYNLFNVF